MRGDPIRVVKLALLLLSAAASLAAARGAEIAVELAPERTVRAGSHTSIEVIVQLPAGNDSPLLITPSVEGEAVEVVRGRLTRPDAKPVDGDASRLRFEIPVLAKSEGTAILRVDVMTYVCERACRRVLVRASEVLRVRAE
jgi:hypothetical protein